MTPHSSSLQSFLKDCIMNWSFMTKANSLVMPWREAVPLNYPLSMKLVPKPTVVWRMCPYGGGFMNPDFMMQALVTLKSDFNFLYLKSTRYDHWCQTLINVKKKIMMKTASKGLCTKFGCQCRLVARFRSVTGWTACWQTEYRRRKPSFGCNCAFTCMRR